MNKSKILLYISIITSISCNSQNNNEKLERKVDSLTSEIDSLKKQKGESTVNQKKGKGISTPPKNTIVMTGREIFEKKEPVPPDPALKTPTIYYYTNPHIVSATITPWVNNRRKIILYDLQGNITYETEDNISFKNSQLTTRPITNIHPNGSIAEIITVHYGTFAVNPTPENWFTSESITYFDTDNKPQWRKHTQNPNTMYEESVKYYWDTNNKKWVKQEVINEQEYKGQ